MATFLSSNQDKFNCVKLLGTWVNNYSLEDLLKIINKILRSEQKSIIGNVNIHALNLGYNTLWFRNFLNQADIVFCDGYGVILGARLLGFKIKERITYAEWTWDLAKMAEQERFSVFLLGSKPGVAEKAAQKLREAHPELQFVGTMHGYFDKTPGSTENEAVVAEINRVKPNILMVGFGMPLQEKWIQENFERLEVNVFLPVGAALDYVAGVVPRAPRWMTDHGLEWLGRLVIEPGRLWKRYLIGNPLFFWRIFKQWWRER